MKKLCVLALGLLALPAFADNDRGFYLGVGAASIDTQVDELERIRSIELFGGYKYNAALGIELRLGNGDAVSASSQYVDTKGSHSGTLEYEIGSYQSIYYKPELVNDEAKLYALLGYTHVDSSNKMIDTSGNLVSNYSGSSSGFSYGIGVGFVINAHFNVNIEYRNLSEDLTNKPNVAALNFDYRF